MTKNLKIAIVHDYIKEFGGAESVLETLIDIFPGATVFTTVYFPQFLGPHRQRLESKITHINTSFFQKIPFSYKIISPLRLLSPLAFKQFDFSNFDYIISSATGAYFPNSLNKKTAKLICYCHTPPRYLYGLPTARKMSNLPILKQIIQIINFFLRILDQKYSQNVDQYIANSQTTADRIKKFYNRDSIIINPPINLPKTVLKPPFSREEGALREGGFFIAGGRLARAKRYDIAIHACQLLGVKLKIFGRDFANYESELKEISNSNIEFLGEVDNHTKFQLLSQAQGFIFCSEHEDFGIAPVEAMACGCPVVAYQSGGVTETVVDGRTGYFYQKQSSKSCAQAIKKLIKHPLSSQDCISQSQKFSLETFVSKIKSLITF